MIWMDIKYWVSKIYYKLTGKEHPHDSAMKRDPFIYEE